MILIPPMTALPKRRSQGAMASWPVFNLIFVLGVSVLLNILLVTRIVAR